MSDQPLIVLAPESERSAVVQRRRAVGFALGVVGVAAIFAAAIIGWGLMVVIAVLALVGAYELVTDPPARPRRGDLRQFPRCTCDDGFMDCPLHGTRGRR